MTSHQQLVDAHPKWSKGVREAILAMAEQAPAASTVEYLPTASRPPLALGEADAPVGPGVVATPEAAAEPVAPPAAEPWLTDHELATLMDRCPRTITRWRKQGMPHGGRPGGAVRYQLTDCSAWRRQRLGLTYDETDREHDRQRVARLRGASSRRAETHAPADAARTRANTPLPGRAGLTQGARSGTRSAPPVEPVSLPAAPAVEPWVDVATVARHLACLEDHIYALAKRTDSRRIPHRREGRRLLFKLSRVDEWLERVGA